MKQVFMKITLKIIVAASLLLGLNHPWSVSAQGTAFTYQGQLQSNGGPASGTYNLQFTLYTNSSGGTAVAGPVTNSAVTVTGGLFTVTVDFGSGVWNGQSNWLQIAVETNGGSAFANLSPRQEVTPVPYAIFAEGGNAAGLSGTVPAASLAGVYGSGVSFTNPGNSFIGNGGGLTGVNAAMLDGFGAAAFWKTTGNAGTLPGVNFIGTSDNEPLYLSANDQPVLRLIPDASTNDSPDIIGGSQSNVVTAGLVGVTIGGGALNSIGPSAPIGSNPFGDMSSYPAIGASYTFVGGGLLNQVQSNCTFSTVSGGALNTVEAGAIESTIAGGFANTILPTGLWSAIAGGTYHFIGDNNGFIGGGWANVIAAGGGVYSVIGGGDHNLIQGEADHSVIAGGEYNTITGSASLPVYAIISGGYGNTIQTNGSYCTIAGGYENTIWTNTSYASVGGGQNNTVQPEASDSVVAGGYGNSTANSYATVSGGAFNTASGYLATVAGGDRNGASYFYATVSGGYEDMASGYAATIGGGYQNIASGWYSTLPGGLGNTNGPYANYSVIAGGINNNTAADAEAIGGGEGNTIAGYADHSAIAGGYYNDIGGQPSGAEYLASYSAIAGGSSNEIFGVFDFIGGGSNNIAQGGSSYDAIGGGINNLVAAAYATVGGGYQNKAEGSSGYTTVGGGYQNTATGIYGNIGGGANNTASGAWSAVGGGYSNSAGGTTATVPGGVGNTASSVGSFAAGQDAQSLNSGAFVWSDGSATTSSSANNQFVARASGGFVFYTSSANSAGAQLPAGSGSWSSLSDRNAKDDFAQVDARSVLARVASLPMTTWSYKTEPGVRHVGPMAQDFYAAFNVGEDERHIATVDESGVALAAIQGLNEKLEEKDKEIQQLQQSVAQLQAMVSELARNKSK
jgi:trimeric autotransporter adhesin